MVAPPDGRQEDGGPDAGPVVRDRRRLDPDTGKVREAYSASRTAPADAPGPAETTDDATDRESSNGASQQGENLTAAAEAAAEPDEVTARLAEELATVSSLAEERLADLQRLQAEFVNYRRRVERDRGVARDTAVAGVLEALLPVLDDVHLARQHGDLETGPFAAIAEKLESVLARYGLDRYGEPGETFDPAVHEALVHTEAELAEGTTDTTVVQVLQPGYRAGDRVLRAARVAVADPPQ